MCIRDSPIRTLSATAAALLLLGGCVKKSEYDVLQIENQALQTRVDETNHLLVQSQADLSALQVQMQQFAAVQTQLQKTQQELTQSQDQFKALKSQFDHFRTQRRSAMVGKKFPEMCIRDRCGTAPASAPHPWCGCGQTSRRRFRRPCARP